MVTEKTFDKIILEARIEAIEKIISPYLRAFNHEIFCLKIEAQIFDENGEVEKIYLFNHLPYGDIPKRIPSIPGEFKDYLQQIIERYKVEQMQLKQELETLK